MINEKKLDFWLNNNLNVLITGEYGVGKTAIVEGTFQRNGLKLFDVESYEDDDPDQMYYLYFSAGTMDPFVDLIGVPREQNKDRKDGTRFTYLDLLRPLPLAIDRIHAIFLDELNRADAKVRNAVMEIIQFQRINGKKFHNLKVIWGAINPETKEKRYDVERLDPAQQDRFHIQTEIDFKPDRAYFVRKFGEEQAKVALDWWENLKDLKILCSPRRLDMGITIHNMGGDLADVMNKKLSVKKLKETLANGLAREKLARLLEQKKYDEAEEFLNSKNIYEEIEPWFIENKDSKKYVKDIFRLINPEFMAKLVSKERANNEFLKPLYEQYYTCEKIGATLGTLMRTTEDKSLQSIINKNIPVFKTGNAGKEPIKFTPTKNSNITFSTQFKNWNAQNFWSKDNSANEIIKEAQNVPHDISDDDCKHVTRVLEGLIKELHVDVLRARKEEILGPFNYVLQKQNLDISQTPFYKFGFNKLAKYKLEQYLWTPESK